MKQSFILSIFLALSLNCLAQQKDTGTPVTDASEDDSSGISKTALSAGDSIVSRIVLIGDAGALTPEGHHTVVQAVEKYITLDKKTTVVFLGDNLYQHGLPDEQYLTYNQTRAVLDSQANIADHFPGNVYFIPGNHDWMNGLPGGYEAVLREQRYLMALGKKNLKYYPEDGCPGPEEIDLGNDVVLVIMDSQWWLHKNDKPGIESDCQFKTKEEVLSEIRDIITANYKKLVIFACHHPFKSNGPHGGYYTIKQHIFPFTDIKKNLYIPLPVLGSIYPIARGVFGTQEDLKYPGYINMVAQVDEILKTHPNVIHVAGHEHALQWIADSNNNYICSGSGCRTNRISKSRHSKFVARQLGFATLEISKNKNVRCTFYGAWPDSVKELYSDNVLNYSKLPPQKQPDTTTPIATFLDTAVVPASHQYERPTALRKLLMGSNYRKEWSQPVNLKVFHINTEKGGFKIKGAGGGFQTKTLHLRDKAGKQWNLRTIDKDPQRVIPGNLRETFARDVVQDMISAALPYAPLAVSHMADAAGVVEAKPEFFYVPDDPAFGFYRPLFAHKVCLLEQQDPTYDGSKSKSTAKVINKIIGVNDHFVDQKQVLRARLLDMMIGDWDRHFDQWHWGVDDTGKGKLYYPIARDRDQAFFNSDGLVMKLATRRRLPWMRGFKYRYQKFNWLSYSPRDFDRIFLNELDAKDWEQGIHDFVATQPDTVIHAAIGKMPPEITAIDGSMLEGKLRHRRDALPPKALRYYRFLSKEVNVLGSNLNEYFSVKGNDSGVLVQVHAREPGKDTTLLMYSRQFDPHVTKEIRLYGFNGNDVFNVDKDLHTKMRIRMIGGRGNDTFNVQGRARSHIYDVSTEPNPILASVHTDVMTSSDPNINQYSIQEFKYDFNRIPWVNLGYNPEDGVLLGLGLWHRTYGFRKDPFKSEHKLSTLISPSNRAYQVKYRGTFTGIYRNLDLLVNGDFQNPAITNFYGYGNNTERLPGLGVSYYRARYKYVAGDLMLQERMFGILKVAVGPTFYYYWNHRETNEDHILQVPELVGLDSGSIFSRKTYVGGRVDVNINNLNSELFPTRGISWITSFKAMAGANSNSRPITSLTSDMTLYASLSDPARLIAVLSAGGGHIFSKDFEFFQAMGVGANNYLRGFRKNRFSGRSMAYGSAELRAKIVDVGSYILPGAFGVVGFDDVARVWTDDQVSHTWHNAYGAGLYYIPFNMFIISGTVAFSKEETLFNLTIGTKLNLTF